MGLGLIAALGKIGFSSQGVSSVITVYFPLGRGPEDYLSQRETWGATKVFDETMAAMSATGHLLSRTSEIGSQSATFRLNFKNQWAHDFFIWKVRTENIVDQKKLSDLGYIFRREMVRA